MLGHVCVPIGCDSVGPSLVLHSCVSVPSHTSKCSMNVLLFLAITTVSWALSPSGYFARYSQRCIPGGVWLDMHQV